MAEASVPLIPDAPVVPDSALGRENPHAETDGAQHAFETLIHRIHHDLNGPLATISGLVQIARLESDPEAMMRHLDLIQGLSTKLSGILEELVEVSQIRQVPPRMQWVNLDDEIELSVGSFSEWPEAREVNIQVEPGGLELITDQVRLRSVLSHVISNAILHQDEKREGHWVRIRQEADQDHIRIIVTDNGMGISESLLPHVFHMFVTGEEGHRGSGLGLYLARQAMLSIGGNIALQSRQGVGTRAILHFSRIKHLEG